MTDEEITQSLMETLAKIRIERDDLKEELRRRELCYFCSLRLFLRSVVKKLRFE